MRHGATEWNVAGRYQGHSDVALSQVGQRQAQAIANRLADEPVESIFSSDLERARATAEAIAARHAVRVELDPRLREFNFGTWEGRTWAEIAASQPDLLDAADMVAAYAPPGGETLDDVTRRWLDFNADLNRRGVRRAIVVTHAGMLHAIVRAVKPRGAEEAVTGRFRFLPASITRIRFAENDATALELSDARHLDERSPHWPAARESTQP